MKPCLPLRRGRLRPATRGDLNDLLRLLHEADVRRYLCDNVMLPRAQVSEMLDNSVTLDAQGLGNWVIEDASQRFCGIAGLIPVPPETSIASEMEGEIELVIALNPNYWGQGLAKEALDTLILYAGTALKLSRLVAAVDEPNTRSHKLMRRCGFETMGKAAGPAHELKLYDMAIETSKSPKKTSARRP